MEARLSKRLQCAAGLVSPGDWVVDVGTDHAYLPIYLVQSGKARQALAADVGEGPLEKARENIGSYGLSGSIHTLLSDGLEKVSIQAGRPEDGPGQAGPLPGISTSGRTKDQEAKAGQAAKPGKKAMVFRKRGVIPAGSSLVITGMGGPLMLRILFRFPEKTLAFKELVLGPQSEVEQFRESLLSAGFSIEREELVEEEGKFYPILRVIPPSEEAFREKTAPGRIMRLPKSRMEKAALCFGKPCSALSRETLLRYLDLQQKEREGVLRHLEKSAPGTGRARRRQEELLEELEVIRMARMQMDSCIAGDLPYDKKRESRAIKDHASRKAVPYVTALPGETADDAASTSQGGTK